MLACLIVYGGYMITISSRYFLLFLVIAGLNSYSDSLQAMHGARDLLKKRRDAAMEQTKRLREQSARDVTEIEKLRKGNEFLSVQVKSLGYAVKRQELELKSKKLSKKSNKLTEEERLEKIQFRMKVLYYLPVIYLNLCTLSAIYNFNIEPAFIIFYIVTYLVDQVSFSSDVPKFLAETWVNVIRGSGSDGDLNQIVSDQMPPSEISSDEEGDEEQSCDEQPVRPHSPVTSVLSNLTPEQQAMAERLKRLFLNPEGQSED